MDPDTPSGPPSREEFNRLKGHLVGLRNALRALIAAAPDPAAALAAVESCFATEEALGQSAEHIDIWTRQGLQAALDELKEPIHHEWTLDGDPDGLIAEAQAKFRARERVLNANLMRRSIEPGVPGSQADDDAEPGAALPP